MTKNEFQRILDSIHALDIRLARLEEQTKGLPKRLSALERWRERIIGMSMAVGAVSGLLTGLVLWVLTKIF